MPAFKPGDLAVLVCGSPRMAVEAVDGDAISLVWCNEGIIHRDTFATALLKKWEMREGDDRGPKRPYDKPGREAGRGAGPYGKTGPKRPYDKSAGDGAHGAERGDKGKTGWHGKPREKTHFRKD